MRKILAVLFAILISDISYSDDRRFTFTYESPTLSKNEKDFELWTTYRGSRETFYSAIDNRLEYEVGLTNKLQTAFYLNTRNTTSANSTTGAYDTKFEFKGISSEWKYQAFNKYRDGIGFAPYLELGLNTDEIKLEAKLIADKQISKKFLAAFNVVCEYEWEYNPSPTPTAKKLELEFDLGLAYDITSDFSVGIEARSLTEYPDGMGSVFSSIFVGPNFSYRSEGWFMACTYLPQLPAIQRSVNDPTSALVLDEQDRNMVRLILGFTI